MAKNSLDSQRTRVARIIAALKGTYPDAKCALHHSNPQELLVATILSAQCTDARVNMVTRDLFKKYKSARAYAEAPQGELEKDIQSTGFFNNKARSLRGMGAAIAEQHHGKVPDSMEELTRLPGVGRKTANVVLGNAFGKNVGVVVDTHVTRVANRLRLTKHAVDAIKIEQDLMKIVPPNEWTLFAHLLIHHGRQICQARKPKCAVCPVLADCPAGKKFLAAGQKNKR